MAYKLSVKPKSVVNVKKTPKITNNSVAKSATATLKNIATKTSNPMVSGVNLLGTKPQPVVTQTGGQSKGVASTKSNPLAGPQSIGVASSKPAPKQIPVEGQSKGKATTSGASSKASQMLAGKTPTPTTQSKATVSSARTIGLPSAISAMKIVPSSSRGFAPMQSQTVMDYSTTGNNDLEAQQARFEEEATQFEKPNASDFKRERMREVRDQINVYERLRAEELARQKEMDTGEQNKLRAILAAAGTTATAYGQGAETRQNQSDVRDAEAINNKYALPITQLQAEAAQKAESDYKNAIITSAAEQGFTTPLEISRYANSQGIPLSVSEIQDYTSTFTDKSAETGIIPAADAAKFGVPYGTTYAQLQGQTITTASATPKQFNYVANMYAGRVQQAQDVMDATEQYVASLGGVDLMTKRMLAQKKLGNMLVKDPNLQKQFQAERNFVNAVLRRESGAAIAQSEYESAAMQYFPMPGDTPEVLAQKRANRQQVIEALQLESGPLYQGNSQQNYGGQSQTSDYSNIDLNNIDAAIDALL